MKINTIRLFTGLAMVIAGIIAGLYVGFWICLVGGLTTIISMLSGSVAVAALPLAVAIVKLTSGGFFGLVSAIILIIPGFALLES